MPVIGNVLFIPITAVFLNTFLCDEAVGDHLNQSILNKDCSMYCWRDMHYLYSLIAGICILVYHPSAVYLRPTW